MKTFTLILIVCLLVATVPVCRAQEGPQFPARPDSMIMQAPVTAAPGADSTLQRPSPADTFNSVKQTSVKPAVRRWDRTRIIVVSCIAALAIVTGVVAIKASYWPGSR